MFINSLLLVWTTFLPAWYCSFSAAPTAQSGVAAARRPRGDGRHQGALRAVAAGSQDARGDARPALPAPVRRLAGRRGSEPAKPAPGAPSTASRFPAARACAGYNNPTWPRREKCKEGNLAYFYEVMGGYDRYDFVSQLDADHVPDPTLPDRDDSSVRRPDGRLRRGAQRLRRQRRPAPGRRAAACTPRRRCTASCRPATTRTSRRCASAATTPSARARCVEIGGLGPELAEDFSTTLLMNAGGWRGAFALDAAAHGDGPASLADCIPRSSSGAAA